MTNLGQFNAAAGRRVRWMGMPSTVIRTHWYSAARRELTVLFLSGKTYTYRDVPEHVYAGMKAASSKGEYFNREIRGRFAFVRNTDALG